MILFLMPVVAWFLAAMVFLGLPFPVFADDILYNLNFEDWDNNGPIGWQKSTATNFSTTMSSDSGQIKSGTRSALLNVNTNTYRYVYTTGNVSGSTPYRFSGFFRGISGSFNAVLRLAWYAEGSNSQLSTDDSNSMSGVSDNFSEVAVEVTSPATAKTVKARVVITPTNSSTSNSLLVDNLNFSQVAVSSQNNQDPQVVVSAPTPKIDWALEDKTYVGRDFKTTKLELSNFESNTEYFLKLRAGTEEGKLTKIQTKNGSAYLSDGESWSEFPLIKTDEKAKWTGEIKGLLTEGKPEGKYKILLRIRKKDTESFYESDIKELYFIKVADEVIVFATPAAATKSVSLKDNIATKSVAVIVMASPSAKQSILGTKTQKTFDPIPIILIVTGVIFSAASVGLFLEGKGIYGIIKRILIRQ